MSNICPVAKREYSQRVLNQNNNIFISLMSEFYHLHPRMSLHPEGLLTEDDYVSVAETLQNTPVATIQHIVVVVHVEQVAEQHKFEAAPDSFVEHENPVLARAQLTSHAQHYTHSHHPGKPAIISHANKRRQNI